MSTAQPACIATTKAGAPCKNKAREDEATCYAHRSFKATKVEEPVVKESVAEEVPIAEDDPAAGRDEMFNRLVSELNGIVDEIRGRVPDFAPPAYSPQALLDLLKGNMEKIRGAEIDVDITIESKLVSDLQEELKGKTAQDFLAPETWQSLWYVVNYSLQEQSGNLRQKVTETMSDQVGSLPGIEKIGQLQDELEIHSPKDLLSPKTWQGILSFTNKTLQEQAEAIRSRVKK